VISAAVAVAAATVAVVQSERCKINLYEKYFINIQVGYRCTIT
jgi:hypothetical protein